MICHNTRNIKIQKHIKAVLSKIIQCMFQLPSLLSPNILLSFFLSTLCFMRHYPLSEYFQASHSPNIKLF